MKPATPKYKQMADTLIGQIQSGVLHGNTFLPSERILAERLGLSRVTVRAGLDHMVREHYLEPMHGKGYRIVEIPHEPDSQTLSIGGLWCAGDISDITLQMFHSAADEAEKSGYMLFLSNSGDDEAQQAFKLNAMLAKKTVGLLVVPTYSEVSNGEKLGNHQLLKLVHDSGKPLVLLDRPFSETDLPCVVNDDEAGGTAAARWLIKRGHSRILMLITDRDYYISCRRFGSFRKECGEHHVALWEKQFPTRGSLQDIYAVFRKQLREITKLIAAEKITAVFINQGLLGERIMLDLDSAPLEFVIYDQPDIFAAHRPTLLIQRPLDEIAREATALLLSEIHNGRTGEPVQRRISPRVTEPPVCG